MPEPGSNGVRLADVAGRVLGEGAVKLRDLANDPYLPEEDAMRLLLQLGEDQDRARAGDFVNLDAYYEANPEALDAYTPYIDRAAQNKADEESERQRLQEEQQAQLKAAVEGALRRDALGQATEEDRMVLDFVNAQPVGMGQGDAAYDEMMSRISSVAMNDPQVYDEMREVINEQARYASAMGMTLDEYWEAYPESARDIAQYDEAARRRLEVKWSTPPDGSAVTPGIAVLNFLLGEDVVRETGDNEGVGLWTVLTRGVKDGTLKTGASLLDAIYYGVVGHAEEENAGINTRDYRANHGERWREYLRDITSPAAPLVPLRTDYSALAGLPPAYIEPQEIDILHDEAVTYAEALTAAGITVQLNEVSGSYHGFDAESDNAFVSRVIQRRLCAMKTMLESSSRQPRP